MILTGTLIIRAHTADLDLITMTKIAFIYSPSILSYRII